MSKDQKKSGSRKAKRIKRTSQHDEMAISPSKFFSLPREIRDIIYYRILPVGALKYSPSLRLCHQALEIANNLNLNIDTNHGRVLQARLMEEIQHYFFEQIVLDLYIDKFSDALDGSAGNNDYSEPYDVRPHIENVVIHIITEDFDRHDVKRKLDMVAQLPALKTMTLSILAWERYPKYPFLLVKLIAGICAGFAQKFGDHFQISVGTPYPLDVNASCGKAWFRSSGSLKYMTDLFEGAWNES
ncbi:MAG: hypothetical protein Q9164_005308 [Protoblastenia rupestris]